MRVLALSLVLLGVMSPAYAQVQLSQDESQFTNIVNQFRQYLSLPTLSIQPQLQQAATDHSQWMAQYNLLAHFGPVQSMDPFDRMKQAGYTTYTYAGENIACGNKDALNTFRQWAFSPGHLENLVNPYFQEMGIARAENVCPVCTGPNCTPCCPYYWTNDFGSHVDTKGLPPTFPNISSISDAIVQASGAIPAGTIVSLPSSSDSSEEPNPSLPIQLNNTAPSEQGDYALLSSGRSSIGMKNPLVVLECIIPYSLGKNIVAYNSNVDTLLIATEQSTGIYSLKLNYFRNGTLSTLTPVVLNNVPITRNTASSVITLLSEESKDTEAFSIQISTTTNTAQFNAVDSAKVVSGGLICSYKIR